MTMTFADYSEPAFLHTVGLKEAVCSAKGTRLRLLYEDGAEVALDAEAIRLACRCAWCTKAKMDGTFPASFPEIALQGIESFGGYAFNLIFSDGHARGVFPFVYLRNLGVEDSNMQTPQELNSP